LPSRETGKLVEYSAYEDWIRVKQQAAEEAPVCGKALNAMLAQGQQARAVAGGRKWLTQGTFRHPFFSCVHYS